MESLIKLHKQKFNKEPYIIGMFWNDTETQIDYIVNAIKDNKPYNEYELLSDIDKKAFNEGSLSF